LRDIVKIIDDRISTLEFVMKSAGKHVIKTSSIWKAIPADIQFAMADDTDLSYCVKSGCGQVIQSRLQNRGYKSLGDGFFVNLNDCFNVEYLKRLFDNSEMSLKEKKEALSRVRRQCDGQGEFIFDGNSFIGYEFNKTQEEFIDCLEADAV
jgi:hypothetical protein